MEKDGILILNNPPGLTESKPLDFLNRPQSEFVKGVKKFVLGHPTQS
jgi:hypothetical protein